MTRPNHLQSILVFSFFMVVIIGCIYYVLYELLVEVLLNNELWYGASLGDIIFAKNYLGGDPVKFQMFRVIIFLVCLVVSYSLLHLVFKHMHIESSKRSNTLKKVVPLISALSTIIGWQIAEMLQSKYIPFGLVNYVVLGLLVGLSLAIIRNISTKLQSGIVQKSKTHELS